MQLRGPLGLAAEVLELPQAQAVPGHDLHPGVEPLGVARRAVQGDLDPAAGAASIHEQRGGVQGPGDHDVQPAVAVQVRRDEPEIVVRGVEAHHGAHVLEGAVGQAVPQEVRELRLHVALGVRERPAGLHGVQEAVAVEVREVEAPPHRAQPAHRFPGVEPQRGPHLDVRPGRRSDADGRPGVAHAVIEQAVAVEVRRVDAHRRHPQVRADLGAVVHEVDTPRARPVVAPEPRGRAAVRGQEEVEIPVCVAVREDAHLDGRTLALAQQDGRAHGAPVLPEQDEVAARRGLAAPSPSSVPMEGSAMSRSPSPSASPNATVRNDSPRPSASARRGVAGPNPSPPRLAKLNQPCPAPMTTSGSRSPVRSTAAVTNTRAPSGGARTSGTRSNVPSPALA